MPPLGSKLPGVDRISHGMPGRLLVLSNGHGEDLIGLRVLEALHRRCPTLEIQVLPLVGEGTAYTAGEQAGVLRRVGPRQALPSGGFSNQSLRGLLADLASGVLGLSLRQWRLVRRWGLQGDPILAVGDLLPLLLAWSSGARFGFIGTPKSDYTWASGPGSAGVAACYHGLKGSEWDPWEWGLMGSRRCRLVALRDRLTARGLRRHGVAALAPGNPMMDGLQADPLPPELQAWRRLLLLGGSRMPEALANLERLLRALALATVEAPLLVLAPTGARPAPQDWQGLLERLGYTPAAVPEGSGAAAAWRRGQVVLLIGPLGAGKTTLTRGVGRGLSVDDAVTSPTFVIARVHTGRIPLVHVDAYRLSSAAELHDLDLPMDDAVTIVEWGENLAEGLASRRLEVRIDRFTEDDSRTVEIQALGGFELAPL